jgi:pimeloyl-ACP methyl ester carboxylesterase
MPRTVGRLFAALLGALISFSPTIVEGDTDAGPTDPLAGTEITSVFVRVPQNPPAGAPLQVLLALHGMGGNGQDFSKDLLEQADHYHWLIVAPTIEYADWTNPDVVAAEDPLLISALSDYLDQLPQLVQSPTRRLVLILGHSRGAQLAHRFAEFRPDKVLAVAALAAGTYTMPVVSGPTFPYGLRDLPRYAGRAFDPASFSNIPFWVGVGSQDTNPADLPRQWDSVEGTTRVQRAQAFEIAMQRLGAHVDLRVFGNTRHELTSEMRQAACAFLGSAPRIREQHDTPIGFDRVSY